MANSNSNAETEVQDKPGKGSKNDGDMPKGHKSQPEGASTGKFWDNWSIEINNYSNGLQPTA